MDSPYTCDQILLCCEHYVLDMSLSIMSLFYLFHMLRHVQHIVLKDLMHCERQGKKNGAKSTCLGRAWWSVNKCYFYPHLVPPLQPLSCVLFNKMAPGTWSSVSSHRLVKNWWEKRWEKELYLICYSRISNKDVLHAYFLLFQGSLFDLLLFIIKAGNAIWKIPRSLSYRYVLSSAITIIFTELQIWVEFLTDPVFNCDLIFYSILETE